jgi:hypothetical protein
VSHFDASAGGAVKTDPALRGAELLSALVPLVMYLRTASAASYWLDAGEFVAASVDLDIAHPPGHPLTALYGKAFTFLPLGSLAFRVALGQAVAAALAALFVFRACVATARGFGVRSPALLVPIGWTGAWLSQLGYAIWFQAVRPEVYALQGLLLLLALERLAAFHLAGARDTRPLYAASFAIGLGLANHHLMAFLMFPALLWSAACAMRGRGLRPVLICALFGGLALCAYAYLPLRAARHPPANFGDPETFERLAWVVSAKVYASNLGAQVVQPLSERFGDVGVVLVEHFYGVFLIAALFGLYAALRERASRMFGVLWLLCAAPVLIVRPLLGPVRGNPDAIAYMTAGYAATAVLASAGLSAFALIAERRQRAGLGLRATFTAIAAAVVAGASAYVAPQADLSRFHATDTLDEHRYRRLPSRSVLVASSPQLVFRQLELAATEGVRPDVTLVPLPFLRYPGVADAVVRAHPDVRELVNDFLASEQLAPRSLLHLATARPVLIELDPHVSPEVYPLLLPLGAVYGVAGAQAAARSLQGAAIFQHLIYDHVERELGADVREVETSHQLLWWRYMDAVFYAARGQHELARRALAAASKLDARDAQLLALRSAIDGAPAGTPIDVRRFLTFSEPPAH